MLNTKHIAALSLILISVCGLLKAQDFNAAVSTTHDENIFDIHTPLPDQITQLELNASKDWDFDESSLSLNYTGAFLMFRDLTARTYHLHTLSLGSVVHFVREDDEDDT